MGIPVQNSLPALPGRSRPPRSAQGHLRTLPRKPKEPLWSCPSMPHGMGELCSHPAAGGAPAQAPCPTSPSPLGVLLPVPPSPRCCRTCPQGELQLAYNELARSQTRWAQSHVHTTASPLCTGYREQGRWDPWNWGEGRRHKPPLPQHQNRAAPWPDHPASAGH